MEQPPANTLPELSEYLNRQLNELNNVVEIAQLSSILKNLPPRPQVGRLYYFVVIPNTPINIEGFWRYTSSNTWIYIG